MAYIVVQDAIVSANDEFPMCCVRYIGHRQDEAMQVVKRLLTGMYRNWVVVQDRMVDDGEILIRTADGIRHGVISIQTV